MADQSLANDMAHRSLIAFHFEHLRHFQILLDGRIAAKFLDGLDLGIGTLVAGLSEQIE